MKIKSIFIIDNYVLPNKINGTTCNKKLDENSCPFKTFAPSSRTVGMFESTDDMFFQNVSFPKEFNIELQQNFIRLHTFIYNKFIQFWNTEIFPHVRKIPGGRARKLKRSSKTNKLKMISRRNHQSRQIRSRTFKKRISIKK